MEAHNFTCTVEDARALFRRHNLGPDVGMGVFAGAAVEVAEKAQVEVFALGAANVAVPDCSTTEVAGSNDVWR